MTTLGTGSAHQPSAVNAPEKEMPAASGKLNLNETLERPTPRQSASKHYTTTAGNILELDVSVPRVLSTPVKIPAALSAAVSISEKVAPRLTALRAAHMWCQIPKAKKITTIQGGRIETLGAMDVQIFGEGPVVYLVHGWGGHRGQLESFVAPLVEAGYTVVAYDAPSHAGARPGQLGKKKSSVYELVLSLKAIIQHYGSAHAVIAHSLGGAATALLSAEGIDAKKVALICPPSDPIAFVPAFARELGLSDKGSERMLRYLGRIANKPADEVRVLPQLQAAKNLPPALIVVDTKDKEVDFRDGIALAEAWPTHQLVISEGLGHRRILKDDNTVQTVIDFVNQ